MATTKGQKPQTSGTLKPYSSERYAVKVNGSEESKGKNRIKFIQTLDSLPAVDKNDPLMVQERLMLYMELCKQYDVDMSTMGAYKSLGYTYRTVQKWVTGEISCPRDTVDVIEKMNENIKMNLELKLGDNETRNIVGNIFLAKSVYGYKDDKGTDGNTRDKLQGLSKDELDKKYQEDMIIDVDFKPL